MKARFEPAYRPQIQWQKVEEERAVRLRRQRHHFSLLVLPGVVIDPLQVGGFYAQTWTVVHQLAVDFARRKIDERHFIVPRTAYSVRDYAPNSTRYFDSCLRSVTPADSVTSKVLLRTSVDARNRLC